MSKLSRITSSDGASALDSLALDAIKEYQPLHVAACDANGNSPYSTALFHLQQSIQKEIYYASKAEEQARRSKTKYADKQRADQAFAKAKHSLERDLNYLPDEERSKWL